MTTTGAPQEPEPGTTMDPAVEIVVRPHARNLVRFATAHPEVLVLSADLTASCEADELRDEMPDRFVTLGMAEQNMMGFAAGLAREGFVPLVHTFGVFVTRRPFDQVAMSIAYPCLPVRLLGFLPGITTPGGATHQATDDLALMRALPNMTVVECGDATEVESVLDAVHPIAGPVYVRMLRGEVPRLFSASEALVVGRARRLCVGDELCLMSSGICTEEALRARATLEAQGVSVTHLHVGSLKPFDEAALLEALERSPAGIITIENHSIIGGLGSTVAEVMAEAGVARRLVRLGLRDTFAHGASRRHLMREYGLDAAAILSAAARLTKRRIDADALSPDAGSPGDSVAHGTVGTDAREAAGPAKGARSTKAEDL